MHSALGAYALGLQCNIHHTILCAHVITITYHGVIIITIHAAFFLTLYIIGLHGLPYCDAHKARRKIWSRPLPVTPTFVGHAYLFLDAEVGHDF